METEEECLEIIKSLFSKMGASEAQAQVMASQLLKRAGQISQESGITMTEAVEKLLKQIVQAR